LRVLALDVATRTGVADGQPGDTPSLALVKFGREFDQPGDVFTRAALWIMRRLATDRPDLLVLEAPLPKFDSSLLMGLRGVMLGIAGANDVRTVEVSVATWRLYFLGAGNLKGADAKARAVALCARLGWGDDLDHNAAEAAGLWLWGCAQVAPRLVPRHEPLFLRRS
jgi:hypothetical protein